MEKQAVFHRNYLLSLVILNVLVCLASAKGYSALERGRRKLEQFNRLILGISGQSTGQFHNYGCWCNNEGRGEPVDSIDRCCKARHECLAKASAHACNGTVDVDYTIDDFFDILSCHWLRNNDCQQAVCTCDITAARCFRDNYGSYNATYKDYSQDNCADGSSNQNGDPHFVTFDGAKMTYQGDCRFLLAQLDESFVGKLESFNITVLNANDRRGVAFHDEVTLTIANHNATMTVRGELFVDGIPRAIPYTGGPFTVTKHVFKSMFAGGPKSVLNEPILHLSTPLKINVSSSVPHADGQGTHYLRIDIPAAYREKLSGMGGNFNGDQNDDYKLSDGTDIRSITPGAFRSQMIANSWIVKKHPDNDKFPCNIK